jgi:hypothetical protein
VVQFAQKTSILVIPRPGYERGICFLPTAAQQIFRATVPLFGMTSPLTSNRATTGNPGRVFRSLVYLRTLGGSNVVL